MAARQITLDASRVRRLISFVDRRVRRDGCDHTHRFTEEWARAESVDWHDLLDILEANGGYCDCEVVLNLPDNTDIQYPTLPEPADPQNPWLLPPAFACERSAVFTRMIVCQAGLGRDTHAADGEWLVPAPKGATARRRVRRSVNFFVGCQSGLPTEVGVIQECEGISALDFAHKVAGSGFEELAAFTFREAGFVLSQIAPLQPSTAVGTDFADRVGIASRHVELTVHRVIMTR
jgi:hypothetical protein